MSSYYNNIAKKALKEYFNHRSILGYHLLLQRLPFCMVDQPSLLRGYILLVKLIKYVIQYSFLFLYISQPCFGGKEILSLNLMSLNNIFLPELHTNSKGAHFNLYHCGFKQIQMMYATKSLTQSIQS